MRKILSIFIITLIFLPVAAYATWQVADPFHGAKLHPDLQPAATINASDVPVAYQGSSQYLFTTQKAWLTTNLTNMARKYGWRVKWKANRNYHVLLATTLTGQTFPDMAKDLLSHYSLKAYFNRRTRAMTVVDTKHSRYIYK